MAQTEPHPLPMGSEAPTPLSGWERGCPDLAGALAAGEEGPPEGHPQEGLLHGRQEGGLEPQSPGFWAPGAGFVEDTFSTRVGRGWLQDDSSALRLSCKVTSVTK